MKGMMNNMVELSVVVPVYNSFSLSHQFFSSLLLQTYLEFELIIVDDGSTDGTYENIEFQREHFKNFKLVKTSHKGVSHARNVGLRKAIGKYVMFIDFDDTFNPLFFEIMLNSIKNNDCEMVECMVEKNNAPKIENTITISNLEAIKLFYSLEEERILGTVYNKIFLKENIKTLFDEKIMIGEDADFLLNYILNISKVLRIADVLYYHKENQIGIIKSKSFKSYITAQTASIKMLSLILNNYQELNYLAINDVINVTKRLLDFFPSNTRFIFQNLINQIIKYKIVEKSELFTDFFKFDKCEYFVTKGFSNVHIHLGEKAIPRKNYIDLEDFLKHNIYDQSERNNNKIHNLSKLYNEGIFNYAYDNSVTFLKTKFNSVKLTKSIKSKDILKADGIFINFMPEIELELISKIPSYLNKKYLYIHVSSSKKEDEEERRLFNGSLIKFLERENLLTNHTVLIHGIYLNEEELQIIAKNNAWLCVCPLNNKYLNEPINNISKLIKIGIKVCLGTDSITLTGTNSIIENGRYLLDESKIEIDELIQIIFKNNYQLLKDSSSNFKDYYCLWQGGNIKDEYDLIYNEKKLICVYDNELNVYEKNDIFGGYD